MSQDNAKLAEAINLSGLAALHVNTVLHGKCGTYTESDGHDQ